MCRFCPAVVLRQKENRCKHAAETQNCRRKPNIIKLEDGEYTVNVELEGGSGRASVDSEAKVKVTDGQAYATIVWSSTYYDYMLVDGKKYTNENEGGNSTFTFPIAGVPCTMDVVGDTTAMSQPHEIDYTLTFSFAKDVSFKDLKSDKLIDQARMLFDQDLADDKFQG